MSEYAPDLLEQVEPEYPRLPVVSLLISRHHGGKDAANVPGIPKEEVPGTDAPAPAGVREVFQHLEDQLSGKAESEPPSWVFLVGGPGNGKSHQLDALLHRLHGAGLIDVQPVGKLASRYISDKQKELQAGKYRLRVVNDATIRPGAVSKSAPGHLAQDIRASLGEPGDTVGFLLVNVNRGALIEDVASTTELVDGGNQHWAAELELLHWLLHNRSQYKHLKSIAADNQPAYFGCADFYPVPESPAVARVFRISLDQLSLLEESPSLNASEHAVSGLGTFKPNVAPYRLYRFGADSRHSTTAGLLLSGLVSEDRFENAGCIKCPAAKGCPILSNARTLRVASARDGLLDLLRATEIASTHRFTYRDVWTIFCVAIVGRLVEPFRAGTHPCDWARSRVANIDQQGEVLDQLPNLAELVQQRVHHSLWHSPLPTRPFATSKETTPEPLPPSLKFLWMVDPSRDVGGDWADPVNVGMESYNFDQGPRNELQASLSTTLFSELDAEFEDRLVEWLRGDDIPPAKRASEGDVREHLAWLGAAYYRLYGIAQRRPANKELYVEWVKLHNAVATVGQPTPGSLLAKALQRLLLPVMEDWDGHVLLPLLQSRVEPLKAAPPNPVLCAAIPLSGEHQGRVQYEVEGDALWAKLDLGSERLNDTRLPLDYATCREAFAGLHGHGFTDAAGTTVPRVERIRASMLRNSNKLQVLIMHDRAYDME